MKWIALSKVLLAARISGWTEQAGLCCTKHGENDADSGESTNRQDEPGSPAAVSCYFELFGKTKQFDEIICRIVQFIFLFSEREAT
jgi:hypothetical protein